MALYESAKNFLILPILIWAVDLFRDYEAAWLGIGTGQVFNLVMAAAGMVLLIWTIRKPRAPLHLPRPSARAPSWLQVVTFMALIVYPLGIPTSWTQANIAEKRQDAAERVEESARDVPTQVGSD